MVATLHDALGYFRDIMVLLRVAFERAPGLFKGSQDKVTAGLVNTSVLSKEFQLRCAVAGDIVDACQALRKWGAGCTCHDALRSDGKRVECLMAGRRLPECHDRLEAFYKMCLERRERPRYGDWCESVGAFGAIFGGG